MLKLPRMVDTLEPMVPLISAVWTLQLKSRFILTKRIDSKQLQWPVNGQMVWMAPEEWKDVLTAAFQSETVRLAMGMNGGVVMLGLRTSKMGKKRFSEWLEFLKATAEMRGVSVYAYGSEYMEAA